MGRSAHDRGLKATPIGKGWLAILAVLWLATLSTPATAAPTLRLDAPRPFGYSIGDTLRHTLTVEPEPGQRLDESSLPKPGPLNRWLELRRIAVEPGPGRSLRVNLDYQTFYAPLTVKPLRIPGPTLRFEKPGGAVTATAPDWSFSMAPLHGLAVLNGDGLEPLRPDAWPEPPDTTAPLAGLGGFTLAGLGAWLYLGYGRGWFDVGRRGRPALNCAALANRPRERRRCGRVSPACIGPSLPEFLAGRVGYADLRREIEAFFRASYDLFFRDEGAVSRLDSFKNPLPPGESAARGA